MLDFFFFKVLLHFVSEEIHWWWDGGGGAGALLLPSWAGAGGALPSSSPCHQPPVMLSLILVRISKGCGWHPVTHSWAHSTCGLLWGSLALRCWDLLSCFKGKMGMLQTGLRKPCRIEVAKHVLSPTSAEFIRQAWLAFVKQRWDKVSYFFCGSRARVSGWWFSQV